MYPTIVNDERKLFIGAQPFSYLGIPAERLKDDRTPEYDGIDIRQLLGNEQADRLLLSSALRMSTFLYPAQRLFANQSADRSDGRRYQR